MLVVCTLCTVVIPVYSADEASAMIQNVVYNDLPDGTLPDGVLAGADTGVIQYGTANKALNLCCDAGGASVSIPVNGVGSEFIIETELLLPGGVEYKFKIENASIPFELLKADKTGAYLIDGKTVNGISRNKMLKLKIKVNTKNNSYTIIAGDKCIADNYHCKSAFGNITKYSFSFESKDENVNVIVNSIRVYNGSKFRTSFPAVSYNTEKIAEETEPENDSEEAVDDETEFKIAYKENFDGFLNIESYKPVAKQVKATNNTIDIREENNGNKYLYIERQSFDPFVDMYIPIKGKKYIIQMDYRSDNPSGPDRALGANQYSVKINAGGQVSLNDGKVIAKINPSQWTNFAFAIDPQSMSYQVYVNRKLVSGVVRCSVSPDAYQFRFYCWNGNGSNNLMIDNIAVYPGDVLVDVEDYGGFSKEILPSTEDAIAQAGSDGVAFHTMSNRALIGGKRVEVKDRPIWKDDNYYLPASLVSEAFGLTVTSACEKNSLVNGEAIKGTTVDGIAYVEISELCSKILNKNYYVDSEGFGYDKGFGIIGSDDYSAFETDFLKYNELNNYLCYERPTAEQILKLYNKQGTKSHPRTLAVTSDFDKLSREVQYNTEKQKWVDNIISTAEGVLKTGAPTTALDGPRLNSLHGMEGTASTMCLAYKLTGDSRYAEKLYSDLKVLGDRSNWNPGHFLDVGVGASAYALAYDWLYDYWSAEQKKYLEETILNKALTYYYNSLHNGEYTRWIEETVGEGRVGNWPVVCTAGPVMAAIALMDVYPDICSKVVADGLRVVEYTLKGFADDGDWNEGLLYWSYTQKAYAKLIESMENGLGTEFGYFYDIPGIDKTVNFYISLIGPTGGFNYGDAATATADLAPVSWYASQWIYKDEEMAYEIFKFVNKYNKKKNLNGSFWDILKMDNRRSTAEPDNLALEYYSDKMGIGIIRSGWEMDNETYLGYVRGSKSFMSHEHVDHGSFVFDALGVRWVHDLGSDEYNIKNYYHDAYRYRAEAHNVYVINPDEGVGQLINQYGNYNVKKEYNKSSYYSIEDLTSSYATWVNSARRGYKLTDNMNSLIVRDEIDIKEDNSDFYWFLNTMADVEIDGNTAILSDGARMKFEFISNQPLELSVMKCESLPTSPKIEAAAGFAPKSNDAYRKLALTGKVSGKLNITIKLTPVVEGAEFADLTDTPLDDWTLDEEIEKIEAPILTGIAVNGDELTSFRKDVHAYELLTGNDIDSVTVTATSTPDNRVTVSKGSEGTYSITVSSKAYPSVFRSYRLKLYQLKESNAGTTYTMLNPSKLSVSEEPQAANPGKNAMDGDLDTRWAADGEQWIMQEFDKAYDIAAVDVAFMKGDVRYTYFKLQYSNDGENFTTLLDTQSSGTTLKPELIELDKPVNAKYIRLLCNGTSEGSWTSITEFYVYTKK